MIGQLRDVADFHIVTQLAGTSEFWKWIAAFDMFTSKAEKFRLWGNGCSCHTQEFLMRVKVTCHQLSRRLHEAYDNVSNFLDGLVTWANSLTVRDCEGDPQVFSEITFIHILPH